MQRYAEQVLIVLALMLVVCANVFSQTVINDDIDANAPDAWLTWDMDHDPYYIEPPVGETTISITDDQDVMIEPGVIVYMNGNTRLGNYSLIIDGGATLTAEGTSARPITFTSNSLNPAVGDWGSIEFAGATGVDNLATGIFDNCILEYGGDLEEDQHVDISGPIVLYDFSDVTVTDSYIGDCRGSGIGVN